MEPVDPVGDYLITRGTVRKDVTLSVYNPALDTGEPPPAPGPWAKPIPVRGSRGVATTGMAGDVNTTSCTWLITGLTPTADVPRPTLKSRITNGPDVWVIDSITPSPIRGRIWKCECTKAFS